MTAAAGVRIAVTAGGEPTPTEAAALAVAVEFLMRGAGAGEPERPAPASSEWALQGRMADLHWAPLTQRWPGEAHGRTWRRVLS